MRNATGLVREISQRDNLILACLAGTPVYGIAVGVFFALAGFPGGSFLIAGLLAIPMALAFSYAFGLLSAAIPRSGGDYMLVSRILSPSLGLVSSFCMSLAGLLSLAFLSQAFVTIGLGPSLQTIGLVADSPTLFRWGTDLLASQTWQFALGTLVILSGAIAHFGGPGWAKRVMGFGFFFSLAGLAIAVVIAIFTPRHSFIAHFNSFAQPFTDSSDTYADTIATAKKSGVATDAGFSLSATVPVIGIFASFSIFTYFGSFAAGEVRQASTTKMASRMAMGGLIAMFTVLAAAAILFHSWGKPFLTAAYGGGFPSTLGAIPAYFFLTSAQLHSTILAVILCLSFLAVFPMFAAQGYLQLTRVLFAFAFDGILPARVAHVSRRTNAPVVAVAISAVAYTATLAWAVFVADNFIQVIVYATVIQLLAMMLVGVAALAFPYRRPELFRATSAIKRLGGVPITTLAGVAAIAGCAFLWYLYFHYAFFGLADTGAFFIWAGATVGGGLAYYALVRWLRARQGVDLRQVYAEIPPE